LSSATLPKFDCGGVGGEGDLGGCAHLHFFVGRGWEEGLDSPSVGDSNADLGSHTGLEFKAGH